MTDDQGIYLYVPLLASLLDTPDAATALASFELALFAVLIAVSPLVFYALFGSVALATVLTGLLSFLIRQFLSTDVYWLEPWTLLLCLPILFVIDRRWGRWSILALTAIVVVGSFATSIRLHAGLPVAAGAMVVLGLNARSLKLMVLGTIPILVAYMSVGTGIDVVRQYRDAVVGDPELSARYSSEHPFWHSAYIGLGYLPNPYGIAYDDAVAAATVERLSPGAQFVSPEYESTLRSEYLRLVEVDSAFIAANYATKLGAVLADARARFPLALLFLPILALSPGARSFRRFLIVMVPGLLLCIVPPILTMPYTHYAAGWHAIWGLVTLLGVGWLWTSRSALAAAVSGSVAQSRNQSRGAFVGNLARSVAQSPMSWAALALLVATTVWVDLLTPWILASFR